MKKSITMFLFVAIGASQLSFPQRQPNRYEVELMTNPNPGKKDTREVNAVLIFGPDSLILESRRRKETLKTFQYANIKSAEHFYSSHWSVFNMNAATVVLTVFTAIPIFFPRKKKRHWLNLVSDTDFAVVKMESDNFRLIRNELLLRKIELSEVDEDHK